MENYSETIFKKTGKPGLIKQAVQKICFCFLVILCAGQLHAQTSIHIENANLEQVLKEIGKKNNFQLFYNSKTAQNIKGITLQLNNTSIDNILEQALKGTGLGYAITGNTIVIRQQSQNKNSIEVSGNVIDKNKEPLIGASVIIEGTTIGVSTDVNGKFSIKVPANVAAITVSFIGYQNKNVAIMNTDKPQVFEVILEEDAKQMEEVVVTGYQTISKERATGSFAKIGNETLELRRMDKLSSMLEGQVAGYTNGQIRGITTMNAVSQPLVVIDGFPVENTSYGRSGTTENMPDLNPEDIDNITILKDAAAASIYGARAANGVIVITTKKAKQGKTEVSASATFTINPYYLYTDNLTNSADIVEMEREWAQNNKSLQNGNAGKLAGQIYNDGALPSAGVDALLKMYTNDITSEEANSILDKLSTRGYGYYDQVKKHTKQNPFYQQYNLRVGKTTEQNSFSASATYWKNSSEDINSHDNKLSINIINSLKITKWLSFDAGVYLKYGKEQKQTYTALNPGFSFLAYDQLVADDGSYVSAVSQNKKDIRDNIAKYGMYNEIITPMNEIGYRLNKSKELNSRVYGKLKLDFTSWLNYDVMFQYEAGRADSDMLGEKGSYYTQAQINKFTGLGTDGKSLVYNLPNGDTYSTQTNNTTAYNFRQQLNLNKTFAEKHNVVWILGNETRSTLMSYQTNTLYGYDSELLSWTQIDAQRLASGVSVINNGRAYLSVNDIAQKGEILNRFVSIYSNLAYTYNDRYAFSGSIRWDRSNLWGSNIKNQNKPLWSVGGSWLINKEDFFQVDQLNLLKLRLSYGIGGNIGRNTAPYLIAKYFTDYFTGVNAGLIKTLPNPDIRWEKTATTNIGIDFAAFNNRLSGTIEYYNKYSTDLLAQISTSPTTGMAFGTTTTNNGKMTNRGIELTLKGDIIRSRDFTWNSTLLYAYNKNKVNSVNIKATSTNMLLEFPKNYPSIGEAFNGILAYRWAGIDSKGDPQVYDNKGEKTTGPISDSDVNSLYYCGTATPIHSGTFSNLFSYKNFELSAMLLFETGHKIRETNIPQINMTTGRITTTAKDITKRWKTAGDENRTDVPRLLFSDSDGYNTARYDLYANSDLFVYDASNIRIRNISFAYRLPNNICKRLMMSGVKLQFNVENVATIAFDKKASYALGGKVKPNYVFAVNLNF